MQIHIRISFKKASSEVMKKFNLEMRKTMNSITRIKPICKCTNTAIRLSSSIDLAQILETNRKDIFFFSKRQFIFRLDSCLAPFILSNDHSAANWNYSYQTMRPKVSNFLSINVVIVTM